jgi:dGTP triphosphohydrolase
VKKILGDRNGQIINKLILDIIENSKESEKIGFSDLTYEIVTKLKHFNYKYIYAHPELKRYDIFCDKIINNLFDYLFNLLDKNNFNFEKYSESCIELDKNLEDIFTTCIIFIQIILITNKL